MNKVFCTNCKYYNQGEYSDDFCGSKAEVKFNYLYPYFEYAAPKIKNHNNDCKEFEPNLMYKIKQLFKIGGVHD